MNRPLRRVAVAFMVLFLALLVNVNYIQAYQAKDLNDRTTNHRVVLDEYSRERGPILVQDQRIAYSVKTKDELEYLRTYKNPNLYAPLTGYYSSIYGSGGLERTQNDVLAGTDDRLFVRHVVDLVTNRPAKGGSILLSIDRAAQEAAVNGLRGKKGAVVALDPRTGAVLAMASTPTYDPNKLASHSTKTQQQAWKEWNPTPDTEHVMNNRATQFTYPPGSSFKLVVSAAALGSGAYQPDTELPAPAKLDLPKSTKTLNNWQRGYCLPGRKQVTLTQALETSCNTAFGGLGAKLGQNALRSQAEKFGFGESFLPELPGGASSRFPSKMDQAQTILSSIGQYDVAATPLQMAMVTAAIANGGEVMEPYLVAKQNGPDLQTLSVTEPKTYGRAMTEENAGKLRDMLVSVVEHGTGGPAKIPGVKVAGKTGTAQTTTDKPPYAWFVSFAPADNPKVAVAVVIEEAPVGRNEISGGKLAAPIAKDVMQAVLGK